MDNNTQLSDGNILVPFPDAEGMRDGKEIKTWMNGWEEGYRTKMKEYETQATSHSVKDVEGKIPTEIELMARIEYEKILHKHITYSDFVLAFSIGFKAAQSSPIEEQDPCEFCGNPLRQQMKGCMEITCYRQNLTKKESSKKI